MQLETVEGQTYRQLEVGQWEILPGWLDDQRNLTGLVGNIISIHQLFLNNPLSLRYFGYVCANANPISFFWGAIQNRHINQPAFDYHSCLKGKFMENPIFARKNGDVLHAFPQTSSLNKHFINPYLTLQQPPRQVIYAPLLKLAHALEYINIDVGTHHVVSNM